MKNIIFDFGNVLIDLDIPATYRALKELIAEEEKETAEDYINEQVKKYETGKISTELFINSILKISRTSVQAKEVIDAWNKMLIGIPANRMDWLREMKKYHRMAIFSNTNELHIENVYQHLRRDHAGLDFENEFFEGVFYSHILGCRKPEVDCFELVLDKLGWKASETVFIDDLEENIKAADKAGIIGMQLMADVAIEDVIPPGSLFARHK